MKAKYFIKQAKNKQFYFVLKAKNGRTILQSEMYKTERGCLNGVASVQKNGGTDIIINQVGNKYAQNRRELGLK